MTKRFANTRADLDYRRVNLGRGSVAEWISDTIRDFVGQPNWGSRFEIDQEELFLYAECQGSLAGTRTRYLPLISWGMWDDRPCQPQLHPLLVIFLLVVQIAARVVRMVLLVAPERLLPTESRVQREGILPFG